MPSETVANRRADGALLCSVCERQPHSRRLPSVCLPASHVSPLRPRVSQCMSPLGPCRRAAQPQPHPPQQTKPRPTRPVRFVCVKAAAAGRRAEASLVKTRTVGVITRLRCGTMAHAAPAARHPLSPLRRERRQAEFLPGQGRVGRRPVSRSWARGSSVSPRGSAGSPAWRQRRLEDAGRGRARTAASSGTPRRPRNAARRTPKTRSARADPIPNTA